MDEYTKQARTYPAVIAAIVCSIPTTVFIGHIPCIYDFFADWWHYLLLIIPTAVIYGALGFFFRELFRSTSKWLFQFRLFKEDETKMPTTDMLIYSKHLLSTDSIKKISEKIKSDYDIYLEDEEGQKKDEQNARLKIAEAVRMIRQNTREDKFLIRCNINYGFWRNLLGGWLWTMIITLALTLISMYLDLGINCIMWASFIVELILFMLFMYVFMPQSGREYARQLFTTYLNE